MNVLDELIKIARQDKSQNGYTFFNRPGIIKEATTELAQLRAAAAERDALQEAVNKAREVIKGYRGLPTGPKGYTSMPLFDLHNAADEWLTAHPATPAPEQGGEK